MNTCSAAPPPPPAASSWMYIESFGQLRRPLDSASGKHAALIATSVFLPASWQQKPDLSMDADLIVVLQVLEPLADVSSFPPPPPSGSDHPGWADDVWASPLNISRRIWCNRSLNMRRIKVSRVLPFLKCPAGRSAVASSCVFGMLHLSLQ